MEAVGSSSKVIFDDFATPVNRMGTVSVFHDSELDRALGMLSGFEEEAVYSDEEFYDRNERFACSSSEEDSDDENRNWPAAPTTNDDNQDEGVWNAHRGEIDEPISSNAVESVQVPAESTSPYDYFRLLFTEELLEDIVTATNEFADKVETTCNCTSNRWKKLDIPELLTFLGILFYMGTVQMNTFTDYWRQHIMYSCYIVRRHMSKMRFLLIFKFLRFGRDNLVSLLEHFNNTMHGIFTPGTDLMIGESLILSRYRVGVRNERGVLGSHDVKLHTLTSRSGISLQLHVYKKVEELREKKCIEDIVKNLMSKYLNAGHHLYLPRLYSSIDLAEFFLRNNTNLTGSLRSYRKGNPRVVSKSKLKRGNGIYRFNSKGVCVCKWRNVDEGTFLALTTHHVSDLISSAESGKTKLKPNMIQQYAKFKNVYSVKQEQILKHYIGERYQMRWYKKVGLHVFQLMFMNAYYMYKMHKRPSINFYTFRNRVLTELLPDPFASEA